MVVYLILACVLILGIPWAIINLYSSPSIFPASQAPTSRVAIVFGAGLQWDGTPSPVLRDRVATAADLYFAGKVEKLLMSGDNRFPGLQRTGSDVSLCLRPGRPA